MRYLRLSEILYLHGRIIEKSGGICGIRNLGGLESAIALPKQFFGGTELYPSFIEKAAVFCFSIVANHPFIDGNKRVGHASMETFLILNGTEITASVDEQTKVMLALASGEMSRETFVQWLRNNTEIRGSG
ncbi:MAG: type II toxin-antitoxin system death-on-curing family toxin [Leptolinea sp.]